MKLTISEAAAHCGYKSRSVIYRLQQSGLLRDYEAGRMGRSLLLESHPPGRCPLRDHIAASVQLRHDSPLGQHPSPMAELSDAELAAYCDEHLGEAAVAPLDDWIASRQQAPDWPRIAARLNAYLGQDWPAPPWDEGQAATVALCLELAQEGAGG